MAPGIFIEPDSRLVDALDPARILGITIPSGYKAMRAARPLLGTNRIFDSIQDRIAKLKIPHEDQCSAYYYFDLVSTLRDFYGEFDRVVEVGVFMGGSSAVFAGCVERFDFDLDLVDISAEYLRFSYERIRRLFPEAEGRIRLFHGDLPAYVASVMMKEETGKCVVHHDGAHDFNQVVIDMASLSFVADQVHSVIAQDTHLRGSLKYMNFVDLALYAVFGHDLSYAPIGAVHGEGDPTTRPNRFQGNYFMPGVPEGFVIPMALNEFKYPHSSMTAEEFFRAALAHGSSDGDVPRLTFEVAGGDERDRNSDEDAVGEELVGDAVKRVRQG